jgi:hypothetical protein
MPQAVPGTGVAAEQVSDIERIHQRKKAADKELRELLKATGTTLTHLNGTGPSGAGRLLIEAGGIARFPPKRTSRRGTAPPRSTGPPASRSATGSHGRATGRSAASCTSWPSSSCVTAAAKAARITRVLRPQGRSREDTQRSHAVPQTPALRHRLPPDDPGCLRQENGHGRTHGGGHWLQHGRLTPRCPHFGEVTSRTRHQPAYGGPLLGT